MELIQKVLLLLPVVIAIMLGVNVVLGGLAQIFHALKLAGPETAMGKVAAVVAKLLDLLQANLPH